MAIGNGTYRAKATGQCILGTSKDKGTPFLECYFEIVKGENAGGQVRWTTYFTEKTSKRSLEAMANMGWDGEDLSEFVDGGLHGLDANEVDVVVEVEEYTNAEGETKSSPRVQWVNRAGGYLNTDSAMNAEAAQSFGERMRGMVAAMRAKRPAREDASFAFGANATPAALPPVTGQMLPIDPAKKPF